MSKLLAALKADPLNPVHVSAIRQHVRKHPMAVCFLTADDITLLALHGIV